MSIDKENSGTKKDTNNNNTTETKEDINLIKNEILETATILPSTISYTSNLLPDAIFLTTSNGQLITTSTLNPSMALTQLPNTNNTTSLGEDKIQMKSEFEEKNGIELNAPANQKPSAKRKSSANTTSSIPTTIKSTTKKKEPTLLAANFPFLTATGLASSLTQVGFSAHNNFTSGFAPITTFSLQNPLLAPSLTIPIYNSLVAVAGTHKDIIVPNLNKDLFVSNPPVSKKQTSKNNKQNIAVLSQNGNAMTTSRGRKRTAQSRLPAKLKEPAAVARRNARERRRVKMVNDGFLRLRRHVPTDPKNKKLSKVKTLRLAIEYIHHLQQLLQSDSSVKHSTAAQLVSSFAQVASYEDLDGSNGGWLHSEALGRVSRDMDEDIFQTIDPARLRTTSYTEFVTR